ncbi:MAG: NADH-quinone oxidoreductase subunit N [Bacteroidia bacterium]|nr:NADH-quinone oxidoreductase subunit N [Bacteroidia bacterium]
MLTEFLQSLKHELLLCIVLFSILILKIRDEGRGQHSWALIVHVLLALNFIAGFFWNGSGDLFNGMFKVNDLILLEKNILNLGLLLVSLQAHPWIRTHRHLPEFYMLMVSTLIGMFFMISSGHLLLFYIGLELSTIPMAALANFNLNKSSSSEAGMKMIMSSAFSSALLLMGISLLYGSCGSLSFSSISATLSGTPLQVFAFVLLFTGFAFKLSAVPFHFWTADVYEGSPVPVAAYLSVVSKAAVAFVFVTVLYQVFTSMAATWYALLALVSVLTILIGNLFALRQQNMKRFLAFSSIAQVGFILIGITSGSQEGEASVVYFLLIYLFSNLGAFGVVNLVSSVSGRENINDYKGFYKSNPALSWILTLSLFSLAGVPPTAGFFGKLFLLTAGASTGNYLLIGIAAVNMVISMYYYLRIVKAIFMDENEFPVPAIRTGLVPGLAMLICLLGILFTGFSGQLYQYIHSLSSGI